MRWITLAHLHLDRVATAWLIGRFVDHEAAFEYLPWDRDLPAETDGVRLFGIPGTALANHDEHGTCFRKVLVAYGLEGDRALDLLEQAVDAGVRHALGLEAASGRDPEIEAIGTTLDLIGIGFGVSSDDEQHLARATPLYDALYRLCQSRTLPTGVQAEIPRLPGDRATFLREAIGIA